MSDSVRSLLALLPPVRRARGYRLYTVDDRRIIDLYQETGCAALGHRPGRLVHNIKNVLERGVLSAFASREQSRAARHVRALFPQLHAFSGPPAIDVRFFRTDSCYPSPEGIVDLAHPDVEAETGAATSPVPLWRPWLPPDRQQRGLDLFSRTGVMIVHLPIPSLFALETRIYPGGESAPNGDILPEPALKAVSLVAVQLSATERVVEETLPGFLSCGPYLWMRDYNVVSLPEYRRRFAEFLQRGMLISPDPALPSILPGELSDGEQKLLARAAAEVMGESNGN